LKLSQIDYGIVEDPRTALSSHPQGLTIRFEVAPGSSELRVPSGFNPWRKALDARLTEPPHHGKANQQLTKEVARILGIAQSDVEVLSGSRSTRKVLLVKGMDIDAALLIFNRLR
jgi:uncharacterized protein